MLDGFDIRCLSAGVDPNMVYEINGELIRRIAPSATSEPRWKYSEEFLSSQEVEHLKSKGWIAGYDPTILQLGNQKYIRLHRIAPLASRITWCNTQLRDAFVLIAQINEFLERTGSKWRTTDCHLANLAFDGPFPRYMDFGSFSHTENGLGCFSARFGRSPPFDSWKEALEAVSIREVHETASGWENYHNGPLPSDRSQIKPITKEHELILGWVAKKHPAWVLDVGAGIGVLSRIIATSGCKVLSTDKSGELVAACYQNARALSLPITSAVFDVRTSYNCDYSLTSPMVIASSLSHHLQRQGMEFTEQEIAWRVLSTRWLALEYIDPSDEHVSKWDISWTEGDFLNVMNQHWCIIDQANPEGPPRTWYLFQRK